MKKRLVSLFLAIVCILVFSGCSTDGASLFSALQKDLQITSVKTTETLSGNMKITLPQEIKDDMDINIQSILNMLSSFRIEGTTLQQMKGNAATAKSNLSLISEDLSFDTELYASASSDNVKAIIKIPTPAKAFLPQRYENASYFTIDTNDAQAMTEKQEELERLEAEYYGYDYTESVVPAMIYSGNLTVARTFGASYFQFLKDYAVLMSDAPEIVSRKNNTYSVYITDETFKDLLRSMVLTYFDKPQARDEIAELMNAFVSYYQSIYPDEISAEMPFELPALADDNPAYVANLRAQAELMINILEPVRMIGEDGIRIDYKVNSAGYITEIDANIHLDFDINAITELMEGEAYYEEDFAFEMKLQYNQKRQNINGIHQIPFPALNEENNLPFYQMLTDTIQEEIDYLKDRIENGDSFWDEPEESLALPAPDGSVSVVMNYGGWLELIDFGESSPFISEDGILYVPMESMMDNFGMSYDWNDETGYALFINPYNNNWMWFRPGNNVICCDDYELTLSAPTLEKDGQIYLPLRSFVSAFSDCRIRWNAEEKAAYLIPWYYMD